MASFAEATAIRALDSHTYLARFPEDWSIGSVPHGGFVTSCFLSATALHFSTTHAARHQTHTITLHLTFLRRTSVGAARFTIRDVKLGRRTSTVHVSLTQPEDARDAEPRVVGYLTQSNLGTEEGISLRTEWALHPPPPAVASATMQAVGEGEDDNWTLTTLPHPEFRKASQKTEMYVPRNGQLRPGMADQWMRLRHGERFTQESLGFVVDHFRQIVEICPGTDPPPPPPSSQSPSQSALGGREKESKPNWYPTILLNLDVKKALPEEGVEWLFVRVRAKKIENGRMDLEVVVLDEGGDLVAVSNHVCLILSGDRNMVRSGNGKRDGGEGSKL
ncbi:MAG: hypothetical protein Q9211_001791 [Gyalolechia sp. 1 TL-2023]